MKLVDNRMIYGEMPDRIHALVANALTQKEVQPMKRKSITALVLAAVLILVLACTALAVGLNLTAQYAAVRQAREAVMEAYGFTMETLGFFYTETMAEKGGGWTIEFHPIPMEYVDRLGTYTVTVPDSGAPTVRWSHDGADPQAAADGRMDASVWGHKQVEQVMAFDEAYRTKLRALMDEKGDIYFWTLQERAELDQMLLETGHAPSSQSINTLPGPEDLTEEEALAIAKEAIRSKYGIAEEALAGYHVFTWFMQSPQEAEPNYFFHLTTDPEMTYDVESMDVFTVSVYSPSGKTSGCYWSVAPALFRLPEGPLAAYEEAVEEFMTMGAFDKLGHEEKADVARRVQEAGFGRLLDGTLYVSPSASAIGEEEARSAAQEALEDRYGLTEEMWTLFGVKTSHLREAGKPVWRVELAHDSMVFYYRPFEYRDRLGVYTAIIDAQTGEALDAYWSLDGVEDPGPYTADNWAQATAWNADILAYTLAFDKAVAAYTEAYPRDDVWTVEEAAGHSELFRSAGFDRETYCYGKPGSEDIPQAEALEMALEALHAEYGVAIETLQTYRIIASFDVFDPEKPIWSFSLHSTSPGREDSYYATLAARTGEIIGLEYVAKGNG